MTEPKGPTVLVGSNKIAMSRALGAAFLNHQVEQLERTTNNNSNNTTRNTRSDASNWRARPESPTSSRRTTNPPAAAGGGGSPPRHARGKKPDIRQQQQQQQTNATARRPGGGAGSGGAGARREKEADVVVVDASVLVHCISQIKAWCRDGREEVIIVPLEALNTLDLLKKGTSPIAQRARAASRMLESQVGTNARIQVQSDSAFVLWDDIPFTDNNVNNTDNNNNATTDNNTPAPPSPEWLRRTVCCARYESTQALSERKRAVLAVLAPSSSHSSSSLAVPGTTDDAESANSPVPLPAPHPSPGHKFEVRAQGTLVRAWAARAGISVLDVRPTPDGSSESDLSGVHHRESTPGGGRRRTSGPSPEQQQQMHYGGGGAGGQYGGHHGGQQAVRRVPSRGQPSLVERPPAVRAMMEAVAQPTRVVRVLARGEKLDP
jgi:hypothetical protein